MDSNRKRELILAMAISLAPDVLLLDMPIRHDAFGDRCLRRFDELRERGTLVVSETRDLRTTRLSPDRVVTLAGGRVIDEAGTPSAVPGSG